MLIYVMLAAALPLALACSCPPAPAASEVCGSDHVTYDSQCHLDCAAVPSLSLKHPGPCLPEVADSAALLIGGRDQHRWRRSTEEYRRWEECEKERRCKEATAACGCDEYDDDCKDMCRGNCRCGCGGYPPGGMDYGLWGECDKRLKCQKTYFQCSDGCGGKEKECKEECFQDYTKCSCECIQQAQPATQRKLNWEACLEQHQCHNRTCSECQGPHPDKLCPKRCERKCNCECAGHLRRDLMSGEWQKCFIGTQSCEQAHRACAGKCSKNDQNCEDKCDLDLLDCSCVCRSATEAERHMLDECKDIQCETKTCSECREGDPDCRERCRRNCECGCLGINADSLDDNSVLQCKIDSGCDTNLKNCLDRCDSDTLGDTAKRKECQYRCALASEKCYCECARSRPPERVEIIQHCNFIN